MEAKNTKIEIVYRPEYADMIMSDIQVHGSPVRSPKPWHLELPYKAKIRQSTRIYANSPNVKIYQSPIGGTIVEINLAMSAVDFEKYKLAMLSGKSFKIFAPENKMLKFSGDRTIQQKVISMNRHAGGFKKFHAPEGFVKLLGLDIDGATGTMKVTVGI